jgi:hypothetical protein
MKHKEIQHVEIKAEAVRGLLEHAKARLDEKHYELFESIVKSYVALSELVDEKRMTIRELRKLLFGSTTETLTNVLEEVGKGRGPEARGDEESSAPEGGAERGVAAELGEKGPPEREKAGEEKPAGHGRNGAEDYIGAERLEVAHPSLKPGSPCPEEGCKGKLYDFEPRKLVRIVGQAPVAATVTVVAQLRCNLCLKVFTAPLPADADEKYDASAGSMIALLRYGTGVPFHRLWKLEKSFGIPLAPSTQWDVVKRAVKKVLPAYKALVHAAAQGDVFYVDDTPMKILALMEKKKGKSDDG